MDYGWYLPAQLLLYLLFWLVYRRWDAPWSPLVITGLFILLAVPNGGLLWLTSILCFPLGIWWSDHFAWLDVMLRTHWLRIFGVVFLVFGITLLLGNLPVFPLIPQTGIKMLSAVFFAAFVVTVLVKLPIQCRVTRFLGQISGEMYVMQGFGFRLFASLRDTGHLWRYLLGILAVSILGGWLLHQVNSRIYSAFR